MPASRPTNATFPSPTKHTAALSAENSKDLVRATPTSKPGQRNASVTHVTGVKTNAIIPNGAKLTKSITPNERTHSNRVGLTLQH